MVSIFKKLFSSKKENKSDLKEIKKKASEKYYKMAVAYFKRKEYLSSKKYFQKVIEYDPDNKNAQYNLEIVLKKIKQQKDAKTAHKDNIPKPTKAGGQQQPVKQEKKRQSDRKSKAKGRTYYLQILALDQDASNEEITDKISKDFKKWRTRINSPDIKKRYEAEEMMSMISQAKRYLLG